MQCSDQSWQLGHLRSMKCCKRSAHILSSSKNTPSGHQSWYILMRIAVGRIWNWFDSDSCDCFLYRSITEDITNQQLETSRSKQRLFISVFIYIFIYLLFLYLFIYLLNDLFLFCVFDLSPLQLCFKLTSFFFTLDHFIFLIKSSFKLLSETKT